MSAPSPTHAVRGEEQDPYQSLGFLGQGGFGSVDKVYKRSDPSQTLLARKRYRSPQIRQTERQRVLDELKNEADIIRRAKFRHIVEFVDSYTWNEQFCIIMSPVADTNLGDFLIGVDSMKDDEERRLTMSVAFEWPCCLIRAIDYLHEMRIKHRDIKPSNILIKNGKVTLTDFGISKVVSQDDTTGSVGPIGPHTFTYSAPEVPAEEGARRGRATDIYSLRCVFLEIATALICPPGYRADFTNLRIEKSGTQAYAHNKAAILEWIPSLWEFNLLDHGEIAFESAVVCMAFLMLDPDSTKRITSRQLVAMIVHPNLHDMRSIDANGCSECRARNQYQDTHLLLHSRFKPLNSYESHHPVGDQEDPMLLPDWQASKILYLESHM